MVHYRYSSPTTPKTHVVPAYRSPNSDDSTSASSSSLVNEYSWLLAPPQPQPSSLSKPSTFPASLHLSTPPDPLSIVVDGSCSGHPLPYNDSDRKSRLLQCGREVKHLVRTVAPLVSGGILQGLMPLIEVMTLGHLGKSQVAGMGLAHILIVFTGYPLLFGMVGALETLGSQAFTGGERPYLTGIYLQRALLIGSLGFGLILPLWFNSGRLLTAFLHSASDNLIVLEYASSYLRWYFPGFYCLYILSCSKQFLYAQGITFPVPFIKLAGCIVSAAAQWLLVINPSTSVGFVGVPLAMGVANVCMLALVWLYVFRINGSQCWGGWDLSLALCNWRQVLRLAIPGGLMTLGSSGANELVSVGAARLHTAELAAQAVLSSFLRISVIPNSCIGIVAANRMGNLLGSKSHDRARITVLATTFLAGCIALIGFLGLTAFSWVFAGLPDDDSNSTFITAAPYFSLVAFTSVCETFSTSMSGLLRGQGRQALAASVKLIAFYVVAAPIGYIMCFKCQLGLGGLWTGLIFGHGITAMVEGLCIALTNWDQEIAKCQRRVGRDTLVH
ncbi:ethionine resistance protein [Spiromyces aspiralis]|uniref:Ethionine resistance protein n=1 Tax=Spiromyces aspiralis TaxID=68401 RepID=A0ACC1HJP5_9FUNG|nr:ethionine resistance protein [Spiromyces aspiralis]